MKHLLTIAIISGFFFSYGQTDMFWNNYSNLNPAMSGLQYKQHGAISYQTIAPSLSNSHQEVQANYNMLLAEKHGVGINYSGDYNAFMNNKITLNYNYQFNLNRAGKLSTGTAIGVGRSQVRKDFINMYGLPYASEPYNYFNLSFGAAYSWKNLIVGISSGNLFNEENPAFNFTNSNRVGLTTHASYDFQLGKNFQLTPRAIYSTYNGYNRLGMNITTTFKNKFSLGVSSESSDYYGFNLGWDIQEKFRVAYAFGKYFSKLSYGSTFGTHQLTIGYNIKNKPAMRDISGTPDF